MNSGGLEPLEELSRADRSTIASHLTIEADLYNPQLIMDLRVHPQPNRRNPILLVHGLMDTSHKMRKISRHLQDLGWQVFDIDLKANNGDTRLEILAGQVADLVDRTFAPEQQIDLLGFSMGGLVTRYYIQRLGGIDRVQRFITISAPHQGTFAAHFSLRPGCIQMRPNSDFIKDLRRDVDRLNYLNFTSLWTPFDLIILPPSSSQLGIGTERSFPVLAHPLMVADRRMLDAIVEALSQPIASPIRSNWAAPKIA
jgi:triacylglycerol lipase